ncbi:MAG: ABC transporter permease [Chloroflexota bacterium]
MAQYAARRLLLIIPTMVLLTAIVFLLMRVLPGDITEWMLSGFEGGLSKNEQGLATLRANLGLDKPLYMQYLTWLWDMARGDFGESVYSGRSVSGEIWQRFHITLELALLAKILSLVVGIPVGIISAVKQNSWIDLLLRFWSIVFLATPAFWLALLVILGGLFWFNWIPPMGYDPIWKDPMANILQLLWPALILASHALAVMARMTRSTMLEVMREDYIRTARAKGLREQVVIIRHAMKNAMIPVVTMAGLSFANLMAGTVILEAIFGIPGMGQLFIISINNRDYAVVQGVVVVFALMFALTNLIVDLLYGWLDPRISYA